ncbi:hypothetical protein [Micromonospora maritima]|uniref:hypothetical protein n=1 Tax=Micromonospora maritima TaxID=986711 RepID=UPI0037988530
MTTSTARRRDAGLLTMAVLLAVAFFLVPPLLGAVRPGAVPRAFVDYWSAGGPDFPPDLQQLVDQQFRLHLARVAIALPLLAALVAAAYRLPRLRLPIGALALAAAVLLIAEVQGAVSPFGTLLPALASGPADAQLAAVLAQVRDQAEHGPVSPALDVMLDEYVRWHVVKAALVGLLAAVLVGLSVVTWRRRRWLGLLPAVPAVAALVVLAANLSTVANPVAPFLLLLQGS